MVGDNAIAGEHEAVLRADLGDHSLEQSTLLILKGGGGYLVSDYWVEAGMFHLLTTNGERKMFPVSRLDLEETVRINRERNAEFVVRTPEVSEP